jgi:hypothetical protein
LVLVLVRVLDAGDKCSTDARTGRGSRTDDDEHDNRKPWPNAYSARADPACEKIRDGGGGVGVGIECACSSQRLGHICTLLYLRRAVKPATACYDAASAGESQISCGERVLQP